MTLRLCLARRPFAILPIGGWDEDLAKVGSYGSKGSGLTGSPNRDIRLDSGLGTNLYWTLVHIRNMYNVYIYICIYICIYIYICVYIYICIYIYNMYIYIYIFIYLFYLFVYLCVPILISVSIF